MASLCVILLSVITAIFAYVLAPDNSPYANWQTVEIQSKSRAFHNNSCASRQTISKSPGPGHPFKRATAAGTLYPHLQH